MSVRAARMSSLLVATRKLRVAGPSSRSKSRRPCGERKYACRFEREPAIMLICLDVKLSALYAGLSIGSRASGFASKILVGQDSTMVLAMREFRISVGLCVANMTAAFNLRKLLRQSRVLFSKSELS